MSEQNVPNTPVSSTPANPTCQCQPKPAVNAPAGQATPPTAPAGAPKFGRRQMRKQH